MNKLGTVPYNQAAPDQPDLGNPGAEDARNCIPKLRGYGPLNSLAPLTTNSLDSRGLGAASFRDDMNNNAWTYAGDAGKLYRTVDAVWVNSSAGVGGDPGAAPYSAIRWEFEQWENLVYATNGVDLPQVITMGATEFAPVANFADIVRAKHIGVVRNQLVLGNMEDADGSHTDRLRWGPFNNPQGDWAVSPVTLADFQELRGAGGEIKAISGGTEGVVFQERAIWTMSFVGSPTVFRVDNTEQSVGTVASGSVIRYGFHRYFLSEDGFRVMAPGQESIPIGEERVDRTVLAELDTSNLDRVSSAVFDTEQIVVWAYPGSGAVDGQPNKLALFNFASNRWALGDEVLDILFSIATPFTSIDGLAAIYPSIDDVPGSLDDRAFAGGVFFLGAIDAQRRGAAFNGSPKTATLVTGETQHSTGKTFVNYVRPLVSKAQDIQVAIGTRQNQTESPVFTPAQTPNSDGVCTFRSNARYHRYRTEVTGFEDAIGVEAYGQPTGIR